MPKNSNGDVMKIWGHNILLEKKSILFIPHHSLTKSEPFILEKFRYDLLKSSFRKRSEREKAIARIKANIRITQKGKRYPSIFRRNIYKLCFFYGMDERREKAIRILSHFCKKDNWKNTKYMNLLATITIDTSKASCEKLLSVFLQQWKKNRDIFLLGAILRLYLHLGKKSELELWFRNEYGFEVYEPFLLVTLFRKDFQSFAFLLRYYKDKLIVKNTVAFLAKEYRILKYSRRLRIK